MKRLLTLLTLLLVLPLALAVSTQYGKEPLIKVTLISQSPDPVQPGEIATVKFKIENYGKETSQDAIVKLIPSFPFTLYGDTAEKNIGKLRAASTGADAVVVEYKLKIDETAVERETGIKLQVVFEDTAISYTNDELLVDIETRDAILDVTSISSQPEQIPPGESGTINIQVKNLADSTLKDIKFSLGLSDVPLAPFHSSSERKINQLASQYQDNLIFKLIADPSASAGLYKVPLNISYLDEKGNKYDLSDFLAVTIGGAPQLRAYIKKSTVLQSNTPGIITLELANAGASNLKFVEVILQSSDDYDLVSTSNSFYIGDIDSDDTQSEEINIFVRSWRSKLHFPILIKFYDANNKPYQQTYDLELPLYSTWTLKRFGVIQSSNTWIYLLVLILIIMGYIYYKNYYKKGKSFSLALIISDIKNKISKK